MRSPVVPSCVHGMPVGRMFSASYRPAEQAYPMDAGVRNAVPGATNAGHIKEGPVMQARLLQFPVSPAAERRLTRQTLLGALDSAIDTQTELMRLPDDSPFAHFKVTHKAFVAELDAAERSFRGKVA